MESKKPFWEYTLPPGVNIGRVNGVVVVRTIGPDEENFGLLATTVQWNIWKSLTHPSASSGEISSMPVTDDQLANIWLIASLQLVRAGLLGYDTIFAPLIGSIFECEPRTVNTTASARKVIEALRAIRGDKTAVRYGPYFFRVVELLQAEEFTADDQAWADKEFNTWEGITDEEREAWLAEEQQIAPVLMYSNDIYGEWIENVIAMAGRKHMQATTKRAKQNASRNAERDERIRAEFKALRDSGNTVEDARATLATNYSLSIERIAQLTGQKKRRKNP